MNTKLLEEIGLTKIEVKVYLQLLELGSTTVWPLIKKTELHKSTTYNTLERLIEKGIVSFIVKGHKRYYEACEPLNLMAKLEEKEEHLIQTKQQLIRLVQDLQKIKETTPKQEIELFVGKEGVKTACERILRERKLICAYVSGKFRRYMSIYHEQFSAKRKRYGIKLKFIANESTRKERARFKEVPLSERRFIPVYHDPYSSVLVSGDKVLFTIWGEQPIAIFIHSKDIAKNQLAYFNQTWKTAKK